MKQSPLDVCERSPSPKVLAVVRHLKSGCSLASHALGSLSHRGAGDRLTQRYAAIERVGVKLTSFLSCHVPNVGHHGRTTEGRHPNPKNDVSNPINCGAVVECRITA